MPSFWAGEKVNAAAGDDGGLGNTGEQGAKEGIQLPDKKAVDGVLATSIPGGNMGRSRGCSPAARPPMPVAGVRNPSLAELL